MSAPADVREVNGLAIGTVDKRHLCRDIDLAVMLEFARPRKIRELIRRWSGEEGLGDVLVCPSVGRITKAAGKAHAEAVEERVVDEYWLTREQALFIVAKSETKKATALLLEVIRRFTEYESGLRQLDRIHLYLLDTPDDRWVQVFKHRVTTQLAKLYGHVHDPIRGFPVFLCGLVGKLYDAILGKAVADEMRAHKAEDRAKDLRMHQRLTPAAKNMMIAELSHVERLALMCGSPREFWARIGTTYEGAPFQLSFGGEPPELLPKK